MSRLWAFAHRIRCMQILLGRRRCGCSVMSSSVISCSVISYHIVCSVILYVVSYHMCMHVYMCIHARAHDCCLCPHEWCNCNPARAGAYRCVVVSLVTVPCWSLRSTSFLLVLTSILSLSLSLSLSLVLYQFHDPSTMPTSTSSITSCRFLKIQCLTSRRSASPLVHMDVR